MTPSRILVLCSLLLLAVGCGNSNEMISAPATQEDLQTNNSNLKASFGEVNLVTDPVWGRVVRDNLNRQEFLNLDATSAYDYDEVVAETAPGGTFAGWRVAATADLQALGVAANIVPGSTVISMILRTEELRDWFGNVRLSTTHHYTRGLVVDQIDVGGTTGIKQKAFSMGRRFNVAPHEVDFRISGWGPISVDESTYLVRDFTNISFDIKPGSCPNPLNPKSQGKLPTAILGSATFDVRDIDVSSLLLEGVAPLRSSVGDAAGPAGGADCDCTEDGPDGFDDLKLKFSTQAVVAAFRYLEAGEVKTLTITGSLLDGTPFEASDCVVIVGNQGESSSARQR